MGDLAGWLAAWLACVAAWGWATERRRLAAALSEVLVLRDALSRSHALREEIRGALIAARADLADAEAELVEVPARWVCSGCGRQRKTFGGRLLPVCGCHTAARWVAL